MATQSRRFLIPERVFALAFDLDFVSGVIENPGYVIVKCYEKQGRYWCPNPMDCDLCDKFTHLLFQTRFMLEADFENDDNWMQE